MRGGREERERDKRFVFYFYFAFKFFIYNLFTYQLIRSNHILDGQSILGSFPGAHDCF